MSDIEMGKIVILGLEEMNEIYYKRLGDSQQVFRAGPFPLPPLLRYFNPILYLMLALLVALVLRLLQHIKAEAQARDGG
ncbi:MAG: hypothetical protein ACH253_09115, partial [Candidatus Thiodiazotropha sp.]